MRENIREHMIAHTPRGCVKRFSRNSSLIENLTSVFTYLCRNLAMLYEQESCLHLFINKAFPEADVLSPMDSIASGYRRFTFGDGEDHDRKSYEVLRQITCADEHSDIPKVSQLQSERLLQLFDLIRISESSAEQGSGLLIPFNFADLNLGLFVLWGKQKDTKDTPLLENEELLEWIASTYFLLKEFFEREYAMVPEITYIPSLYAARWKKAAILFADIRNFTPLSEVLRNTYARQEKPETRVFRDILNRHCKEMATIIRQEAHGRIDHFFGPGVMAIFGEHEDNPSKAASSAVCAAIRMVEHFQTLKTDFLRTAFGDGYEFEYNESVGIDLGVGIDYGTVLFEYLGDEHHREYTVIGDHVNFAEQLEHEAMQVDKDRQRPPILISPTVERCIRPWIESKESIAISELERGYIYTVYGLYPGNFKQPLFADCIQSDEWDKPWKDAGLLPPT